MSLIKRTNIWVFPVCFLLGFPLVVIVREMLSDVWMDPMWALAIWCWGLFCWIASLVVFRRRYFTDNP